MRSLNVPRRHSGAALLVALAAYFPCVPVSAEALDAKAVGRLLAGHTWVQKKHTGPGYLYWSWKSDGAVCLRDEKAGSCIDTGRWRLERDNVCYELTWWGKSYGLMARCGRVTAKGDGRYEMLSTEGVTTIEFTIAK